jgi:hypothetical protein
MTLKLQKTQDIYTHTTGRCPESMPPLFLDTETFPHANKMSYCR